MWARRFIASTVMAEASHHRPDYERSDVDPRLVAALGIGVAVFLGAAPFVLLSIYPRAGQVTPTIPSETPPAPRLQVSPRADLEALRAAENEQLSTYGWVDRQSGVVHLPIARAITLTAQRGLPGWPKP
jgi:hypothetical protein